MLEKEYANYMFKILSQLMFEYSSEAYYFPQYKIDLSLLLSINVTLELNSFTEIFKFLQLCKNYTDSLWHPNFS